MAARAGAVLGLCLVGFGAAPAGAHTYLLRTDPAQGARLAAAPPAVSLQFSEVVSSAHVRVSLAGGPAELPLSVSIGQGGRVVKADLATRPAGIYEVSWDVVADDGHGADGEFAFAIGPVSAAVPGPRAHNPPPRPEAVVAALLYLGGLTAAAGGLVTAALIDGTVTTRSLAVRLGLLCALGGAATATVIALGPGAASAHQAAVDGAVAVLVSSRSRSPTLTGGRRRSESALSPN